MIFQSLVMILPRFLALILKAKIKKSEARFCSHEHDEQVCQVSYRYCPSDKKVKFNHPSAIELSETAVLCTTLYRNLVQAGNFGGTFDQLFLCISLLMQFSQKMPPCVFYTMVQKSKK